MLKAWRSDIDKESRVTSSIPGDNVFGNRPGESFAFPYACLQNARHDSVLQHHLVQSLGKHLTTSHPANAETCFTDCKRKPWLDKDDLKSDLFSLNYGKAINLDGRSKMQSMHNYM